MKIVYGIGILVALVLLVFLASKIGEVRFNNEVREEIEQILAETNVNQTSLITEKDIAELPEPVQRWLKNSKVIGQEKVKTVRLKQEGYFKTGPDKKWMPYKAEQYYNVEKPAFIWQVKMKAAPAVTISGRDKYHKGKGHMLIKLLSLINVADAKGPEIDQGTLLRFLNETMWFPSAALNDYIEWEEIDQNSARATMSYGDTTASAVFYFNQQGELIDFSADRYMDLEGEYRLEEWRTPIKEHKVMGNRKIPTAGDGIWKLDSGDYTYIRLKITDIDYNVSELY